MLFIDDADVYYRPGTRKELIPLQRFEANPVVPPTRPWEGMIGWVSVYRNPESGLFQMWYQAYNETRKEDPRLKCVVAYAESKDGKHWVKPDLQLFSYYETKETNIVLIGAPNPYGDRYCNSVVVDPQETDPQKRYKMLYYDWDPDQEPNLGSGTRVAFSPDGIHWTKHKSMVHKTAFGGKGEQPPFEDESFYSEKPGKPGARPRKSWRVPLTMSDAIDVFYDKPRQAYVAYGKMWMHGPDGGLAWKHGMGRMESKDFIHWSRPQFILGPQDGDPPQLEFHTSPVFPYNGQYLSLNQILDRPRGHIDIELMSSRDGFEWERPFPGQYILKRNPQPTFDASTLLTNGTPIMMGNDIYFYYGGYRGSAVGGVGLGQQVLGSSEYFSGIGLAIARKDRFVAIVPDPAVNPVALKKITRGEIGKPKTPYAGNNRIGQVTLRALDLSEVREITLNVDASKGNAVVEILNEEGYRIRGFSKADATPITSDTLEGKIVWKENNLSTLKKDRKYLLRIHLNNARLFAVTLK